MQQADTAFRQGFALCPYSPEVVFGYVNFLLESHRSEDARLIALTAVHVEPLKAQFKDLLQRVQKMQAE